MPDLALKQLLDVVLVKFKFCIWERWPLNICSEHFLCMRFKCLACWKEIRNKSLILLIWSFQAMMGCSIHLKVYHSWTFLVNILTTTRILNINPYVVYEALVSHVWILYIVWVGKWEDEWQSIAQGKKQMEEKKNVSSQHTVHHQLSCKFHNSYWPVAVPQGAPCQINYDHMIGTHVFFVCNYPIQWQQPSRFELYGVNMCSNGWKLYTYTGVCIR